MRELLDSSAALESFAGTLAPRIKPHHGATVVGLSGELGAGKTSFVQAAAEALGVTEHVSSPTFVIEKRYRLPSGPFSSLIHIDAYRLKSAEELRALNFVYDAADASNLIFIEWPEHVAEILPADTIRIEIELLPEHARALTYDAENFR